MLMYRPWRGLAQCSAGRTICPGAPRSLAQRRRAALMADAPSSGAALASNRILVVDDDSAILDLIAQVLTDEGYDVLTAGNGRSAVAQAQRARPNLILLDLMMPEMNGWQVIAELRAVPPTRAIPVILLSARRDLAETADNLGAAAFIEKPFDLDDLVGQVRQFLSPGC